LGSSITPWGSAFINVITDPTGSITINPGVITPQVTSLSGPLTLGTIDVTSPILSTSSIVPNSDLTKNLGTSSQRWNNLWVGGTATVNNLVITGSGTGTISSSGSITLLSGSNLTLQSGSIIPFSISAKIVIFSGSVAGYTGPFFAIDGSSNQILFNGASAQTVIQNSINTVSNIGGSTIFIREGIYPVSGLTILDQNNITIKGIWNQSILQLTSNGGVALAIGNQNASDSSFHAQNIVIEDIVVDGGYTGLQNGAAFSITTAKNVLVNRCIFQNSGEVATGGFRLTNWNSTQALSQNIWVTNCYLNQQKVTVSGATNVWMVNNVFDGINAKAVAANRALIDYSKGDIIPTTANRTTNFHFDNNYIKGWSGSAGIAAGLQAISDCTFNDNYITGSTGTLIGTVQPGDAVFDLHGFSVENNVFEGCTGGITFGYGDRVRFKGNKLMTDSAPAGFSTGLTVATGSNGSNPIPSYFEVEDNFIYKWGGIGAVIGFGSGSFKRNTIIDSNQSGLNANSNVGIQINGALNSVDITENQIISTPTGASGAGVSRAISYGNDGIASKNCRLSNNRFFFGSSSGGDPIFFALARDPTFIIDNNIGTGTGSLQFNSVGNVIIPTMSGSTIFLSGSNLTLQSGSITLTGSVQSSGIFSTGNITGSIITGSGFQTASGSTLGAITLQSGSNITLLSGNVNVTGSINLSSGTGSFSNILVTGSNLVLYSGSNIIIQSGSIVGGVLSSESLSGSLILNSGSSITVQSGSIVQSGGTNSFSGSTNITGSTYISGSLVVSGSTILTNLSIPLSSLGTTTFTGSITVNSGSNITIQSGSLNVPTGSSWLNNVFITGSLFNSGSATFSGSTTNSGPVNVLGNLYSTGSTTLTGSLYVSGSTIHTGSLTVVGATTLSGSLTVTGSTTGSLGFQTASGSTFGNVTILSGSSLTVQSGSINMASGSQVLSRTNIGFNIVSGNFSTASNSDTALDNSIGITLTSQKFGQWLVTLAGSLSCTSIGAKVTLGVYRVTGSVIPSSGLPGGSTIIENATWTAYTGSGGSIATGSVAILYFDNLLVPQSGTAPVLGTWTWFLTLRTTAGTAQLSGVNGAPTTWTVMEV
jgi:fibronectin-binding autotransporter adhesin